jgi:hypothetical protein
MSDYTLQATWSTKDALATGQALKAISATEIGTEFDAIAAASATKFDINDFASQAQAEALTLDTVIITPHSLNDVLVDNGGIAKDLQQLADPGADTLFGWDQSASAAIAYLLGEGITSNLTGIELALSEIGTVAIAAADTLIFYDVSGGVNGKTTVTLLEAGLQMANMADFSAAEFVDHTTVDLTVTGPITGGGTIDASRAFAFDISGLSALDSGTIAAADTFLIDDGDGGTNKKIAWQSIGPTIVESSAKTFALTDGNTLFVNTGSVEDTMTVPLNAAVAFPLGTQIGFATQSSAAILIADGGATVNSLNSYLQVKAAGGGAYLVKTGTDVWSLIGDVEA